MRNIYIVFILSLFVSLFSCSTPDNNKQGTREIASISDFFKKEKINFEEVSAEEIAQFEELVEQNLVWREKSIRFYKYISEFEKKEIPIPSSALTRLHDGLTEYKKINDTMFVIIDNLRWIASSKYKLVINSQLPTGEDKQAWQEFSRAQALSEIDSEEEFVQPFIINPTDIKGKNLIIHFKRSFAAALVLYDNYTIAFSLYSDDSKIRRLLNYDNDEHINFLHRSTSRYASMNNRLQLSTSVDLIKKISSYKQKQNIEATAVESYLDELISSSNFFHLFTRDNTVNSGTIKYYQQSITDHLHRISKVTTYGVSKIFGNSMGLFASRKGKMLKLSQQQLTKIERTLQPLDILLEKTPFRLTDKFIPGHFGHVAVWLGSEQELRDLGLWEHDLVKPHHKDIRAGKKILEALRPGVELNTLHHFMNIDDFAVLRHKQLSTEQTVRYLENSFKQIGKTYDFNFDVETDKRIVCSELAYVVYDDMSWPTEKALGRITISPDNVAIKANDNGPFAVKMIFYDGIEIKHNLQKNFSHLLNLEYEQINY